MKLIDFLNKADSADYDIEITKRCFVIGEGDIFTGTIEEYLDNQEIRKYDNSTIFNYGFKIGFGQRKIIEIELA